MRHAARWREWQEGLVDGWHFLCNRGVTWQGVRSLFPCFLLLSLFLILLAGTENMRSAILAREPLEIAVEGRRSEGALQEFLITARALPSVSRLAYRTREQELERSKSLFPALGAKGEEERSFRDTIVVRMGSMEGYGEFFPFLLADGVQRRLFSPATLLRIGEDVRKMEFLARMFRILRGGLLLACIAILLATIPVLRSVIRPHAGEDGENAPLQELLGVSPLRLHLPFIVQGFLLLSGMTIISFAVVFASALAIQGGGGGVLWRGLPLVMLVVPFLAVAAGRGGVRSALMPARVSA